MKPHIKIYGDNIAEFESKLNESGLKCTALIQQVDNLTVQLSESVPVAQLSATQLKFEELEQTMKSAQTLVEEATEASTELQKSTQTKSTANSNHQK